MKDTIYLAINRTGVVRMTKRPPSLYRDEVGVKLTVQVPDASFRPSLLEATLEVSEAAIIQPVVTVEEALEALQSAEEVIADGRAALREARSTP
jgi:hypothetical protein